MKYLKIVPIIALMVIMSFPALGAASDNGNTPLIEKGVFIDHAMGSHSPPPGDDSNDKCRTKQGITWSRSGVLYYDANNIQSTHRTRAGLPRSSKPLKPGTAR